jgi:hypothetical protein
MLPDAHRAPPAPTPHIIGTATFRDIDISILVTTWSDGTGEVAYRERRWDTWSAPVELQVAP